MRDKLLVAISLTFLALAAQASTWYPKQSEDKMDGSTVYGAVIRSDNSMKLGFPYAGENHGTLAVRQRKQDGLNVIFSIDKGQLVCGFGEDCFVMVRFDDAQPVRFVADKPADHSSDTLFIRNASRFVEAAKKAKVIRVAATVYQAGTQVLEFAPTSPLVFETSAKSAPKKMVVDAPKAPATGIQEKLRACNDSAGDKRGDERKAHLSACLSKP